MGESTPFGEFGHPEIPAIHWVGNLEPYIERKLFTVNTGHATVAYHGYHASKKTIAEALQDSRIRNIVRDVLQETASLIIDKHEISAAAQLAERGGKFESLMGSLEMALRFQNVEGD